MKRSIQIDRLGTDEDMEGKVNCVNIKKLPVFSMAAHLFLIFRMNVRQIVASLLYTNKYFSTLNK